VGGTPHIIYRPRADATPESELTALASVYAYLLKNHDSNKADKSAPAPIGRDDAKESNGCIAYSNHSK
jgi:hypothetical protein